MELIFKVVKDKPPFVGIKFINEYDAARTHASYINNYFSVPYKLVIEPVNDILTIRVVDDGMKWFLLYENVTYNPEHLTKFIALHGDKKDFRFGHVVQKGDNLEIAYSITNQRKWALKVIQIKVLVEY